MSLKRVPLKAIKLGLRLGEDVLSSKGILLAKNEQLLDSRLLGVLKSFGVIDVGVMERAEKEIKPLISIDLGVVEKIRGRFKNLDLKSKMIEGLFEICVERQLRSKNITIH